MRKWPTNNSFSHHIPGNHPDNPDFLIILSQGRSEIKHDQEDELDLVYPHYPRILHTAHLLIVEGVVQQQDGVTNFIVSRTALTLRSNHWWR
jgi:hypothetical protein